MSQSLEDSLREADTPYAILDLRTNRLAAANDAFANLTVGLLFAAVFVYALMVVNYQPKSGSWVIATMGRIGAFDGDEHNSFDAFASPGG